MTKRTKYHFVAGDQHMQFVASTLVDAFMGLQRYARKNPVASEFSELKIDAYDAAGNCLASKTWEGFAELVLSDTYGPNWRQITGEFNDAVGAKFY